MIDKDKFLTRLAEIELKKCPLCDAKLVFNKNKTYLACENQYDPTKKFEVNGNGRCTRMITSLKVLTEASLKYGIEIPQELKLS